MFAITFTKASPAGSLPTSTRAKLIRRSGNPPTVHNPTRQDKEGDGQQGKTVKAGCHPVGIGGKGRKHINGHQHGQDTGYADAECNGHTDDQKE